MKISKRASRQVQNLARICSFDTDKRLYRNVSKAGNERLREVVFK